MLTSPLLDTPHTAAVWTHIGDWLLTFQAGPIALPRRRPKAAWQREGQAPSGDLWLAPASDGWAGAPMLYLMTAGWEAWLLGELYGPEQPEQAVIDLLEGRAGGDTLNGHCLLIAHHRTTGTWHVWTDRFATFHAYYATDGRRSALGTFFPAVAAATGRAELDWEGLSSFFGFGFFAGGRTHYRGVSVLRPATHYRYDAEGRLLSESRTWEWSHAPDERRSYDDTVDAFAALFQTVMDELTATGRVALPISGGLDSRSTIAALPPGSDPERFWAYSYGYSDDSVETAIARRIAGARGLRFDALTIQPYLFERLPQVIGSVEGFQDVTQARQAAISADLRRHADSVIAAHWGDVWLDDMGLAGRPAAAIEFDALVGHTEHKMRKPGCDWLLAEVCRPRLASDPENLLHALVADALRPLGGLADPDFRVKAYKTEQWSARWTTASLRMYQAAAFPRLPFYDTRLADFFATVPTEFVAGRRLQIDYLKRYAPDLAAVTWQASGTDLFRAGRPDPLALPRRAINKGLRAATGRKVIERNWEVQFLGEGGRRDLHHWLLRPGLLLHEFVAPAKLRALLDGFFAEPLAGKRGYTLSMLLTFSAWLELHGRQEQGGKAGAA
jgi:hypothetical protein